MSDKLVTALLNTMMCMGTVFLVLIFISLIISLFVYVPGLERRLRRLGSRISRYFARRKPEQPDPERKIPRRPRLSKEELYNQNTEQEPDEGAWIAVIMSLVVLGFPQPVSVSVVQPRVFQQSNVLPRFQP